MSAFCWQTRVYWEDTDGGGIVYYANYLRFLERARTEWLRTRGIVQSVLARDPGIVFAVTSVGVEYRRPARLDELLGISCAPARAGAATLDFRQDIRRDGGSGVLVVEARARIACLDAATLRPRRLPAAILGVLES
ncbi:MAG: tol-pal system-associated acyl-CoA thioesterase [Gammaproteobacteria bacterium]|nr:tol-pal system-associated acyl-CoA thioesterase [Gammaproteobacteria bacterium]